MSRALLLVLALAGCGNDLCDGISGACIDLTVGGSGRIDTLRIHAGGFGFDETRLAPPVATEASLPVYLALSLPKSNGPVALTVTGLLDGATVGSASTSVVLGAGQHRRATVRLGASAPDLAPLADSAVAPDLACGALTPLAGDPHNCGACGHDCLGGGCVNGQCQAMLLALDTAQPPAGLAVDGAAVYFTSSRNGVFSLSLSSGDTRQLYGTTSLLNLLAVLDGTLYFGDQTGLESLPTGGGSATLVSATSGAVAVAVDSGHVYWSTAFGALESLPLPLDGSMPAVVATGVNSCQGLASDGTSLFISNGAVVQKLALPSGTPQTLLTPPGTPMGIAVDPSGLYFAAGSAIFHGSASGSSATALINLGGVLPRAVATDASAVYWAAGDGTIRRLAK